jgi:hypothetical protein
MTTYIIANAKNILQAAEFIIREGEARLGRHFVLWNAAALEEEFFRRQMLPSGSEPEWEYLEEEISLIPRPPKMGVKIVGRHRVIQIEDIFHYSIINGDEWKPSDQGNYIKYMVSLALLHLMQEVVDGENEKVVIEMIDWSLGVYQQLLDEAGNNRQRRRPRRRRGGTTT